MTKNKKPWWTCEVCGKPVSRPGKGSRSAMFEHRKVCEAMACFGIIQHPDKKDRGD